MSTSVFSALETYQNRVGLLRDSATPSLSILGSLLRRTDALGVPADVVISRLSELSQQEVLAQLLSITPRAVAKHFEEAADLAFEAILQDQDSDKQSLLNKACVQLRAFDDALSAFKAAETWQEHFGKTLEVTRQRRSFQENLQRFSAGLKKQVRSLTSLNLYRREELALLNLGDKAMSWWFSDRSQCDGLAENLFAGANYPAHDCPSCQIDLNITTVVSQPPERHLNEDDFWRLDFGGMSSHEKRWAHRHASQCEACRAAIRALSEGEEALHEALKWADEPLKPQDPSTADLPDSLLFDHTQFSVTLIQGNKKRLFIRPKNTKSHINAWLRTSNAKERLARRTSDGLQFDLSAYKKSQSLSIRIELGSEHFDVPIPS